MILPAGFLLSAASVGLLRVGSLAASRESERQMPCPTSPVSGPDERGVVNSMRKILAVGPQRIEATEYGAGQRLGAAGKAYQQTEESR